MVTALTDVESTIQMMLVQADDRDKEWWLNCRRIALDVADMVEVKYGIERTAEIRHENKRLKYQAKQAKRG